MIDLFVPISRKLYNCASTQLALSFRQEAGHGELAARQALLRQILGDRCVLRRTGQPTENLSSSFLAGLCPETHLEGFVVGFDQLCRQGSLRDFLFLFENARIIHRGRQNVSIDCDWAVIEILLIAEHLIGLYFHHSLEVAGPGKDIARCQLTRVPFGRSIRDPCINIAEAATTFLEHVEHILKDDTLDGPVVNLSEIVRLISLQVNHETAAEVVHNLDHAARQ